MKLFTPVAAQQVTALGERRLIARIRRWLGAACPPAPFGIGDDCAVLPPSRREILVTTDPVIAGRHFDASVSPAAAGAKLLKRNLSDIAAMGGTPRSAVVSLALAPETSLAWLREFHRGLARCARTYGVSVVGGDITQAPAGFFGGFLTLLGEASGPRAVTRHGAREGDHLLVTGRLGGSLLGHHHAFSPRLEEGAWLARRREVRAMMDLSDGLAKDVRELLAPPLAPDLDLSALPVCAAAQRMSRKSGRSAIDHALNDGEDYELLLAVDGRRSIAPLLRAWKKRFPQVPLTPIGRVVRQRRSLPPLHGGFEHLVASPSKRGRR
ncbi:MAG TPA: thiamine-phosphate kinase [Candidatus Didemnitutus sp.]|nr:thiamine-phosphate kinase [Candidatus Didemnitutus sp.]